MDPMKVAASPLASHRDEKKRNAYLPKIRGGKCEFTGQQYNDVQKCPWFAFQSLLKTTQDGAKERNVPILPHGTERLPDSFTGNLNFHRTVLVEQGKIVIEDVVKEEAPEPVFVGEKKKKKKKVEEDQEPLALDAE